jgi:hypothetical protein
VTAWPGLGKVDDGPIVEAVPLAPAPADSFCQARVGTFAARAPGLNPREPTRYPAHQDLGRLLPAGTVYAVTRGHHKIFSRHTPMISGGRTRQSADLY